MVITLFNYESYVERCLQSVLAAETPARGLEIVVVDDASSDDSAGVVERMMARAPVPLTLVRKRLNTGLADARNTGFECARGKRVFVLDADNWIYPSCLAMLDDALEAGGAAAYGIIAAMDEESGEATGLLSALDWDVRRLLEAPYIDAMALFDRQAVVDVGGYSVDLIDHGWFGWEDYDLWLKLAQAGHAVRHVPTLVAGYREHPRSMIRRTNRDTAGLAAHLRQKFAELIARHPDLRSYFAVMPGDLDRRSPEELAIAALTSQVRQLETQLAEVYRSGSWRVTAPLRAALDRLRGRRPS